MDDIKQLFSKCCVNKQLSVSPLYYCLTKHLRLNAEHHEHIDSMVISMYQQAGIPCVLCEDDLRSCYEHAALSLMTYYLAMINTTSVDELLSVHTDSNHDGKPGIGQGKGRALCTVCHEPTMITDRILVPHKHKLMIVHQRCFVCCRCERPLRPVQFRESSLAGPGPHMFECVTHERSDLLVVVKPPVLAPKPKKSPSPAPTHLDSTERAPSTEPLDAAKPPVTAPKPKSPSPELTDPAPSAKPLKESTPPIVAPKPKSLSPPPSHPETTEQAPSEPSEDGKLLDTAPESKTSPVTSYPETTEQASPHESDDVKPAVAPKPRKSPSPVISVPETTETAPTEQADEITNVCTKLQSLDVVIEEPTKDVPQEVEKMSPPKRPPRRKKKAPEPPKSLFELYPDYLNPFGSDEEFSEANTSSARSSRPSTPQYDESLNPFDEIDLNDSGHEDCDNKRASMIGHDIITQKQTPEQPSVRPVSMMITTTPKRIDRPKRPAPPPPIPEKRTIMMDASMEQSASLAQLDQELVELDETLHTAAQQSRDTEMVLINLFAEQPDLDWMDENETALRQWMSYVKTLCQHTQTQQTLLQRWHMVYLDALHADIEHQLRIIIEKPSRVKSTKDIETEAMLLEKLVCVIDRKNALIQTNAASDTESPSPRPSELVVHKQKHKSKTVSDLKYLRKKLKSKIKTLHKDKDNVKSPKTQSKS